MGKKVKEYKSGDFIFAKVKGYPAWPARVQKQNGKKYFVYFYGTGETANLPPNMIFDYAENKDKFLNKSIKRKDFNDGVKQIEHDFANNVPLELVVGDLAAEPAPADDSLNDAADDTVDDSAVDTTAADDTIDEKGRKPVAKTPATPKAAPKTPRGRAKKDADAKEDGEDKKEEEVVSRSGRKIKPGKRYLDEETEANAPLPSPAPKKRRGTSPAPDKEKEAKEKPQDRNIKAYNTVQQSELRELKEPFKSADPEKENILIAYLPSGQYCGVKLFQSRPTSFKSDASRLQWDKQAASNAITLKKQLETGQITPQSISAQLVMDLNLTDDERQSLDRDRDLEVKKSRLHFLKTEMRLIELDAKIKTCLSLGKADTELCLKLIDEVLELDLAALMLLKHPTCMETVKRMRVYVGNTPSWEMSEADSLTFSKQAHRIRNKADALFITMRDLFHVPQGVSFWELFNERVAQFKAATENLHADKLLEMVHEPIELSQPIANTNKAAVDAANEQEAKESEDADKKKKATPVKGKRANSTPLKQPLKRGRKQDEKEKEAKEDAAEPDANKPNDTDKTDSEKPKENNENEKVNDAAKADENETNEADKEVEKVNENADKNEEKETEKSVEKDSEVTKDDAKEANSNEKDDEESKKNDTEDKVDEKVEDEKGSKKKEDKVSDKEKSKDNGKNKEKPKEKEDNKEKANDVKNGKDAKTPKAGEKRKDKGDGEPAEKEKDADEPRAKRSRETKKTEPPPRSPAKRKSRS